MKSYSVKIKNVLRRAIALTLVGATALTGFPTVVQASVQNPVPVEGLQGVSISNISSPTNHAAQISWGTPAPTPGDALNPGNRFPERYEIFMRNASASQAFNFGAPVWFTDTGYEQGVGPAATAPYLQAITIPATILSGSIVSFVVRPSRTHWTPGATPEAPNIGTTISPPLEVLMGPEAGRRQQQLFLTDINVEEVWAAEPGITLRWDNPRFDGVDVFTGYRVSFRPANATGPAWTHIMDVPLGHDDIVFSELGGRSQVSFTFPVELLEIGNFFNFRIEPMVGGAVFTSGNINIDGGLYTMVFTGRDFIAEEIYVGPELVVLPAGSESVLLQWDAVAGSTMTEIFELNNDDNPPDLTVIGGARELARFENAFAQTITSLTIPRPTELTWYVVRYTLGSSGTMISNIVYFDPVFNAFRAYSPTIFNVNRTTPPTELGLLLEWRAFTRPHFTAEELANPVFGNPNGHFLDKNVQFEIFVSDNLDRLGLLLEPNYVIQAAELTAHLRAGAGGTPTTQAPLPPAYLFYTNVNHPITTFTSGTGVENIQENEIYYVRIVARRIINGEPSDQWVSENSYNSIFVPPSDPLGLPPAMVPADIMDAYATETSLRMEFNNRWFEAYNRTSNNWYSWVGTNTAGGLLFGNAARGVNNNISLRADAVTTTPNPAEARSLVVERLSLTGVNAAMLVLREVTLANHEFQFAVVAYNQLPEDRDTFMRNIPDGQWTTLEGGTPFDPINPNRQWLDITGLEGNTSYVIFFRAINEHGTSYLPTYVMGTTIITRPPLDPQPSTPIIEVVSVDSDRAITVRWNGALNQSYELFFSELMIDYPEGGGRTQVSEELLLRPANQGGMRYENGFIYFTIDNLFPGTTYYFWVRAISSTGNISTWSNAASGTTLPIERPLPPTGLSYGPETMLTALNRENSTAIQRRSEDYITIAFNRIENDLRNLRVPPTEAYEVENGEATWLTSPSLLANPINSVYLTQFSELVANRSYFVRARTIRTAARGAGNEVIWSYSYTLQFAETRDFLDAIEITLPELEPMAEIPGQMLRVYSDWVTEGPFWTGQDEGEFDSDQNPDLFPLPDQDFYFTGPNPGNNFTLTYRIRGNQIGADGNRDQQVDQRFISRLVTNRVFTFSVPMGTWGGPFPIQNRVVELPFGVVEAFDERQIDLVIDAGNLSLTIPHGSIVTDEVRRLQGLNRYTQVFITLSEQNIPPSGVPVALQSQSHTIEVEFVQGANRVTITDFVRPIELEIISPQGHAVGDNNISGYIYNSNSGGWARVPSVFDAPRGHFAAVPTTPVPVGTVTLESWEAGTFTAISRQIEGNITATPEIIAAMQRVNSHLRITDLGVLHEEQYVHANQFNRILAAILREETQVAMNVPLDQATFMSLGRGGMLISGESVSRQAGISSLVRALEVRTGNPVAFFPGLAQSGFHDMSGVAPQFLQNNLKAEALGFFRGSSVDPTGNLTFGDMMYILDIIFSAL